MELGVLVCDSHRAPGLPVSIRVDVMIKYDWIINIMNDPYLISHAKKLNKYRVKGEIVKGEPEAGALTVDQLKKMGAIGLWDKYEESE